MAEWPKEVPVLTARDICRDFLNGPRGTHCLAGWIESVFGSDTAAAQEIEGYMDENIDESRYAFTSVIRLNDDRSVTKTKLAQFWNQATAHCGYVVGNPEAKKKPRSRPA